MPAKSQAQFRFLQALVHGGLKNKPEGFSPAKAQEFIDSTSSYKALPERLGNANTEAPKQKFPKITSTWKKSK